MCFGEEFVRGALPRTPLGHGASPSGPTYWWSLTRGGKYIFPRLLKANNHAYPTHARAQILKLSHRTRTAHVHATNTCQRSRIPRSAHASYGAQQPRQHCWRTFCPTRAAAVTLGVHKHCHATSKLRLTPAHTRHTIQIDRNRRRPCESPATANEPARATPPNCIGAANIGASESPRRVSVGEISPTVTVSERARLAAIPYSCTPPLWKLRKGQLS